MFGFLDALLPGWPFTLSMIFAVFGLIYVYFTINFNHWRDKGIKFIKPYPFVGSIGPLMLIQEHIIEFNQRLYREYQGEPYVGLFQGRTPTLMVFDKNIIKNIFVKDFAHFTDHGFRINEEADPLEAKNLFNMEGQKWKEMRAKLTPTFTSGRMKAMFPLVLECAEQFEKHLDELASTGEEFESKDLLSCYTTDVIGSCAFGIQCNSIKDPNCEFRVMGKKTVELGFWRALKTMVMFFMPEIGMKLRLAFFDKELSDFFRNLVRDVIALRSKTGNTRKDFMQLLIEIKEKGILSPEEGSDNHEDTNNTKLEWTNDDVVAQALVFFVAGFETSSTLMSFALLELAMYPEVQETLQKEIDEVLQRYDGKPSYQSLQEMPYLDKVIQETLRKYPPVANHTRVCTKNYIIPETKLAIEKGTMVSIPFHALQNDPKYFPDPDCFDPERFSKDETSQKNQYIYTPFGEGPRQCIGNRFALMQSKMGLIAMMRKFSVQKSTRTQYPVKFDPKQFILTAKGGVWLTVTSRH